MFGKKQGSKPVMTRTPNPSLTTSQNINHIYGCNGPTMHLTYGIYLLRTNSNRCQECGYEVSDVTDTPVGQAYKAFARLDLGSQI